MQFNFVGKLLGPKGNSMKRLQEETMTKMAVLGRGSMRDKQKVGPMFAYDFHYFYKTNPCFVTSKYIDNELIN